MSTPDDRDRGLDAMLSRQRLEAVPSDSCLDAETLAAWADEGLDEGTRARAEAHAAGCARCQAMLAALVRSEPDAAPVPRSSVWERLSVRWLIPLTAAAAAIGLWMVAPPPRSETPAGYVAVAPSTRPDQSSDPLLASPQPDDRTANVQPSPSTPPAEAPVPGSQTTTRADRPALQERLAPSAETESKVEAGDAAEKRQELAKQTGAARDAAADAAIEARSRETLVAAAPAEPAVTAAEPVPAPRAAPPPPPASPSAAGRAAAVGLSDAPVASMARRAAPTIISGERSVQWRITGAGVVERSTDGGTSWTGLDTNVVTGLTAGAAPSAEVCWVVGNGGVVLLTTDARTWRRVTVPTGSDLVAVQAVDARTATVRAAGGEQYRTTDGGVTWSRLP